VKVRSEAFVPDLRYCLIHKLSGFFSRVFLLRLDNGKELVVRMPFPVMGPDHLTTASEVATMDFARTELGLPTPSVLAWSSDASKTDVNAEFIMYEKVAGNTLSFTWSDPNTTTRQSLDLTVKFSMQEHQLFKRSFSQIGSIYFKEDVSEELQQRPLFDIDSESSKETQNSARFRIGPTVQREFYRGGRSRLQIDRGPCGFFVVI
jgi:hypothetical protein